MSVDASTAVPEQPSLHAATSAAASAFDPAADAGTEFDRQVAVYVQLGVPALAGLDEAAFRAAVAPLRAEAEALGGAVRAEDSDVPHDDHVPFVLVLAPEVVGPSTLVPAMRRGKLSGITVIDDEEMATYRPVDGVEVPDGFAWLVSGIDTGTTYVNVTPESALAAIRARGRTPLTIAEGIALVVVRPDMLRPNRCFSLAGSRTGTNQRVPAIWISKRQPKLGWCWDRNPHTWLGTASAAQRRGTTQPRGAAPGVTQPA